MTSQNNAAQVAAQAEPCPRLASVAMPTVKQMMLVSLAYVQHSLEGLVHIRCNDDEWDDNDVDIDCAVDIALDDIKLLRQDLPEDRHQFDRRWFMAAAAINLSVEAFRRTDCHYYRALTGVQKVLDVLVTAVEFSELEARHGL